MNILIIGSTMERGGAERVISSLANHWVEIGHSVEIGTLLGSSCQYMLNPEVRFHPMCKKGKPYCLQIPKWIKEIRQSTKKNNVDIVMSFFPKNSVIAWVALRGISCKFVVSERNDPRCDGRGKIVDRMMRFVFSRADKAIVQTEGVRGYYSHRNKNNICVIPNPCVVEPHFGIRTVVPGRVVSVGRLVPQKNHRLLLSAFAEVVKVREEMTLTIYGEGLLRDELISQIELLGLNGKVFLPGNMPNVIDCISDAEMFVLSSDYEGMSNALMEALALGIPCISTDCAGSSDLIVDGENGVLVPVGDKESLVSAMLELSLADERRESLSNEARARAEKYQEENVLKLWDSAVLFE